MSEVVGLLWARAGSRRCPYLSLGEPRPGLSSLAGVGPCGNNFYVITGTPIVGTLFVAAFHAPEAGTMWQAQAALCTLWPFAQRPPHPDNRFFSLAVPWRLAGMAQAPSI